jgi:hypothetical protein
MRGLHHLKVSGTYQPEIDDLSQENFKAFYLKINNHIGRFGIGVNEVLSAWPNTHRSVRKRWQPDNKVRVPKFRLEVFRAGNERMSRRHRRRN